MLGYCSELVTTPAGHSGIAYNEMEVLTRKEAFSVIRHWSGSEKYQFRGAILLHHYFLILCKTV